MTICDATSEYILARPYTETSSSAASMYFAAGPLTAQPPISGLTPTTFFLDLDDSFRLPLIERIGPLLVSGLPGAITTNLESCMAFTAGGFARALSAPTYFIAS